MRALTDDRSLGLRRHPAQLIGVIEAISEEGKVVNRHCIHWRLNGLKQLFGFPQRIDRRNRRRAGSVITFHISNGKFARNPFEMAEQQGHFIPAKVYYTADDEVTIYLSRSLPSLMAACAAARRAIGTRNGEQLT
jgi:hypothetical protein